MSATGGFWPGEAPAAQEEDVQEPEAAVAEPLGWPEPHQEEEAETEPEAEPQAEQTSVAEPAVAEPAVAEPEPAEEAEAEEEAELEVAPIGHVPGELDIPDGVAVLEG